MPDKDDKNKGRTSQPDQYERDKGEVNNIEHDGDPSFKGNMDRQGNAKQNQKGSLKEQSDREEARSVPASKQG